MVCKLVIVVVAGDLIGEAREDGGQGGWKGHHLRSW